MFPFRIVPFPVFLFLFSCCSLFTDYTRLSVVFPSEGAPWEKSGGVRFYLLVYPDPRDPGTLRSCTVSDATEKTIISIRKGTAVPVALYPNGTLKPSGGIFPLDLSGRSTLVLSAEEGFLADILLQLHKENSRIESVNIPRLRKIIAEKCGGDPWVLDGDILKTALLLGSLSVYKIKKKEVLEILIPHVPGIWISDNPFKKKIISSGEGSLELSLYHGLHAFLNVENHDELYVSVSDGRYSFIVKKKK